MKRLLSLLLALCLSLSLSACGKTPAPGSSGSSEPEQVMPTFIDQLHVEFVVGERNPDALLQLRTDFPPLLIAALSEEGVEVGEVEITFGTSGDATARAVKDGSVNLAFIPSEAYLESENGLYLLALEAVSVPANDLLTAEEIADLDGVESDSVFYQEAVVLANDTLADAFTTALLHLCTTADGSTALQKYGSAAYLTEPAPDTLLAPYRAYLIQSTKNE